MPITIGAPAAPDGFSKDAAEGHLLVFIGGTKKEGETQFGTATWAEVQYVADLDTDTIATDVQLFGKMLAPAIYNSDAPVVAGRLVKGKAAKEGQNPPWLLDEIPADELVVVQQWCDMYVTELASGRLIVDVDAVTGK